MPRAATFKRTDDLLEWIRRQPPTESKSGAATKFLYERAVADGAYKATVIGFNNILKKLEGQGSIKREIRGKRTFRIEATDPIIDEPEVIERELQDDGGDDRMGDQGSLADFIEQEPVIVAPVIELEPPVTGDAPTVSVNIGINWSGSLEALPDALVKIAENQAGPAVHDPMLSVALQQVVAELGRITGLLYGHTARIDGIEQGINKFAANMGHAPPIVTGGNGTPPTPTLPLQPLNMRSLGVKNSETRKLVRDLHADGWDVVPAANGHLKVRKEGFKPFDIARTPSDHRTPLNDRSRARANGAAV